MYITPNCTQQNLAKSSNKKTQSKHFVFLQSPPPIPSYLEFVASTMLSLLLLCSPQTFDNPCRPQ